jgi:predicted ribosomally synthesized peptide with SipW-like signal peptide
MKSILTSLGTIVFVAAIVVGGTGAFFSDSETSTGNVFTAGAIDLKVDSVAHINGLVCFNGAWHPDNIVAWNPTAKQNELNPADVNVAAAVATYNTANPSNVPQAGDPCDSSWSLSDLGPSNTFFSYGDLKPGDEGENTISLHVFNNDAYMCAFIHNLEESDNSQTEPEALVDADGLVAGELSQELSFFIWEDDGDNVYEGSPTDGRILVEEASGEGIEGSYPLYTPQTGALAAESTKYLGVYWCYGELTRTGTTLTCDGSSVSNESQTDSLEADISFFVEQSRNNERFTCPDVDDFKPEQTRVIVEADDLAESIQELALSPQSWLFHNDSNNTTFVMALNQFASTGGVNNIVPGPDSVGAARMVLDTGTDPLYSGANIGNPRYNIATYKYKDVKLVDIDSLSYRIYDASPSSLTPYLHFNVDFNNSDTWQRRLVQVPTGVVANTWTTVDALAGSWTYSGPTWPAGLVDVTGTTPGTTARTWAQILANYPNAETRSTDSFFGIRVGHPGPIGEESYVDWVEFNGEVTDFE